MKLLTLLLLLAGVYRNDWQAPLLRLCVHRIFWRRPLIHPQGPDAARGNHCKHIVRRPSA
jgi:hypothetical protein